MNEKELKYLKRFTPDIFPNAIVCKQVVFPVVQYSIDVKERNILIPLKDKFCHLIPPLNNVAVINSYSVLFIQYITRWKEEVAIEYIIKQAIHTSNVALKCSLSKGKKPCESIMASYVLMQMVQPLTWDLVVSVISEMKEKYYIQIFNFNEDEITYWNRPENDRKDTKPDAIIVVREDSLYLTHVLC